MKLKSINKKEDVPRIPIIDNLTSAVVSIVILIVAVVVGVTLVSQQQATYVTGAAGCNTTVTTDCGIEYNASEDGKTSLAVFTSNVGILALALMLFAVLGVIAAFRSN